MICTWVYTCVSLVYPQDDNGHEFLAVNPDLAGDSEVVISERRPSCNLVCEERMTTWIRTCELKLVEGHLMQQDWVTYIEQGVKKAVCWLRSQIIEENLSTCGEDTCVQKLQPVDILCQVRDYETVSGIWRSFDLPYPHSITFVRTPLPRNTLIRIRALFTLSSASKRKLSIPSHLQIAWLPPAEGDVLHVHSLNLWVAPCTASTQSRTSRSCNTGECFNCQSVSCRRMENHGNAMTFVSGLCVSGFDGRLPHTGEYPSPTEIDCLRWFSNFSLKWDASSARIMSRLVLQTRAAFWSIQNALRINSNVVPPARSPAKGTSWSKRTLSSVLIERKVRLCEGRVDADIENTLAPSRRAVSPPPTFVLFVSCPLLPSCQDIWSRIMMALTRLLQDMSLRALELSREQVEAKEQVDFQPLVVAVRVEDLPGDSMILLKPLGPQYDVPNRHMSSYHLDNILDSSTAPSSPISCWSVSVDVCVQSWSRKVDAEPCLLSEGTVGLMCASFQLSDELSHVSIYAPSFKTAFESAIEFTIRRHIHPNYFKGKGTDTESRCSPSGNVSICFEVYIFYTVDHAEHFGGDRTTFENVCEVGLSVTCRRVLGRHFELPALTFIPAVQLSDSKVKVVFAAL